MGGPRKLATAALWRFSEIALSEATSFAVFIALARLVPPDAFGVVALAAVCIAFGQPILTQGIGEALVQRPRVSTSVLDTAFWANMAVGGLLALGAILFGPLLGRLMGEARLGGALAALSPIFLLMAASAVFQAKLRRELNFRAIAMRSVLAIFVGGATGLYLAYHGYGYYALIGQQIAYNATSLIVLALASPWKPRLRVRKRHLKCILSFARHTGLSSFTDFLVNRADVLIAGMFLSTHAVALFFFAKRIVFAAGLFTYYSIQQIGLPIIARRLERQEGSAAARSDTALAALTLSALVCAPALIALSILAEPLIVLSAGAEWRGASTALSFLAFGAIALGLRVTSGQTLIADGRPEIYARLTLASAFLALGFVALGSMISLKGAAIGAGLAHIVILPFALRALAHRFAISGKRLMRSLLRGFAPCIALALAMWAAAPAPDSHDALLLQIAEPALAGIVAWLAACAVVFSPELTAFLRQLSASSGLRAQPATDR